MYWIKRCVSTAFMFLLFTYILASIHDYPLTRQQINKIRIGDPVAVKRQWLQFFYFINEAGSGIKYKISGNPKHMRHYPSLEYLEQQQKNN